MGLLCRTIAKARGVTSLKEALKRGAVEGGIQAASFAAGLLCGDSQQIWRQLIRFESFHLHRDKAKRWNPELASPAGAVHGHCDTSPRTAMAAHNLDGFLHPAPSSYDVLDD